jgi:hypothetical protein
VQLRVLFVNTQPVAGLHVSSVHTLLSAQTRGSATHAPETHRSLTVQASESLQTFASSSTFRQPWTESHESSVHGLLSLQLAVPCTQAPA